MKEEAIKRFCHWAPESTEARVEGSDSEQTRTVIQVAVSVHPCEKPWLPFL